VVSDELQQLSRTHHDERQTHLKYSLLPIAFVCAALLLVVLSRLRIFLRDRKLATRYPGGRVLSCVRGMALSIAIDGYRRTGAWPERLAIPPRSFSLVAGSEGFEIWGNAKGAQLLIPWVGVVAVVPAIVQQAAVPVHGIELRVELEGKQIVLPILVVRRNFLGVLRERREVVSEYCVRFDRRR
jgi:hypothetical protein